MSIEEVAFLLLPADDPAAGRIVRAGEDWRFDASRAADAEVVVWGREPLPSGAPPGRAAAAALARDRSIARLARRPPEGFRVVGVHRWPPPRLRGTARRNAIRDRALGGALIELATASPPQRVLDAAAEAAGHPGRVSRFHPGSGGGILVLGGDRVLRVARAGGPADPTRSGDGLRRLASASLPSGARALIPALLGRGEDAGASWTLEARLPGDRAGRLEAGLAGQVAAFASGLPRADAPATAHRDDLLALSRVVAGRTSALASLGDRLDGAASQLPAILRHGDLWSGNLLALTGRLSGVVDWDAWHASALPGADVLHAVATEEGLRRKEGIGAVWARRPWRWTSFEQATDGYWTALRTRPGGEQLEAIGHAWWAGQVAATLTRLPALLDDARWMSANVHRVLDLLEG